jgi:3-hydroxymyristoyl/3-hydroxydecanoyl-(acyl carrier protein) dehydratase
VSDGNTFVIPADHPAFPGHFPGQPIVPGVLLLGHVAAALARARAPARIAAIRDAKFIAPLGPGEACTIAFADLPSGEVRFECRSGTRVLARGTLAVDAASR